MICCNERCGFYSLALISQCERCVSNRIAQHARAVSQLADELPALIQSIALNGIESGALASVDRMHQDLKTCDEGIGGLVTLSLQNSDDV